MNPWLLIPIFFSSLVLETVQLLFSFMVFNLVLGLFGERRWVKERFNFAAFDLLHASCFYSFGRMIGNCPFECHSLSIANQWEQMGATMKSTVKLPLTGWNTAFSLMWLF